MKSKLRAVRYIYEQRREEGRKGVGWFREAENLGEVG